MTYKDVINGVVADNVLFTVLLELTFKCNLDCFFCYNDVSLRGKQLRTADYVTLLDDLVEMQVMTVTLSGGEPLAHPDFFEIGGAARDRGFVVRVKSNGHAIRGDLARRIKDEVDPFMIEISLHGATGPTHDRQTRVEGSFDRLVENLQGLRDLDLRFKLNAPLTSWNESELEGMFAIADSFGVPLQIDPTITPRDNGDVEPMKIGASPDGIRKLVRLQLERARASGRPAPSFEHPAQDEDVGSPPGKHCGAGSMNVAVDPYGEVFPCVAWRVSAGNLHEQSIKEIWASSPALPDVRDATASARQMLVDEGQVGKAVAFCPGLAVDLTGRPDRISSEQRARAKTILETLENDS